MKGSVAVGMNGSVKERRRAEEGRGSRLRLGW